MNRYQVITYSQDTGADEKRDYITMKEARAAALQRLCFSSGGAGVEEAALVYDLKEKSLRNLGILARFCETEGGVSCD